MLKHIPFYASLLGRELYKGRKAQRNHVLVYGAIETHDLGPKGCIASNKTLSEETAFSIQTVVNAISELARAGWIMVEIDNNNHRQGIQPTLTLQSNPPYSPGLPPLTPESNIEDSKEKTVIDNTIKEKSQMTKIAKQTDPEVEDLFTAWDKTYGYPPRSPAAERREAKKLIKAQGFERVRDAIPAAFAVKDVEYAPVITTFKDLWYKWDKLEAFYRRKQGQQSNRVATITED